MVVPVPGRHAARRRGSRAGDLWAEAAPDPLRHRIGLGPAQVAVIAVLVAVGALVTAVLVVRSAPDAPEVPAAAPVAGGPSALPVSPGDDLVSVPPSVSAPAASGAAAPGAGPVTVDVAGRVRRPGIAVLDGGARVVDALEAAGGAKPGVDLSTLNLARLLVDGEQILVGEEAAAVPAAPPVSGAAPGAVPGAPAALVNLNTATSAELDTLPEVGPVTAAAIIAWRDEHGGFTAVEELLEVQGIGETTLGRIAPYATV